MTKYKVFNCSCMEGSCQLKVDYHDHSEKPVKPRCCPYKLSDGSGWKECLG